MGEMDGMVEIVPQFALSFGATYTLIKGKAKDIKMIKCLYIKFLDSKY